MSPRFTLDAGRQFLANSIAIGTSLDLNSATDLFGGQSQGLGATVLFQPGPWFIPRTRLAVQKDLQDFDPTTYALGLSLFNVLHADVSATGVLSDLISGDDEERANAFRGATAAVSLGASF